MPDEGVVLSVLRIASFSLDAQPELCDDRDTVTPQCEKLSDLY